MFKVLLLAFSCVSHCKASRPVDRLKHVIIFMQENRAFDHYFGSLHGVRGFNDRIGIPMKSGLSSFHQPAIHTKLQKDHMLPFHADSTKSSSMCIGAPLMDYPTDISIWNHGRQDAWNTARDPELGMAYYTRNDLPFYYSLYDGFAVADQYFQSSLTQTNPNRMFLFTGSNGLSVGQKPVLDNDEPTDGFSWETLGKHYSFYVDRMFPFSFTPSCNSGHLWNQEYLLENLSRRRRFRQQCFHVVCAHHTSLHSSWSWIIAWLMVTILLFTGFSGSESMMLEQMYTIKVKNDMQ